MFRESTLVYLSLGSNLGDRRVQLQSAIRRIEERTGDAEAVSPLYRTEAWGNTDQPDFLNLALALRTTLAPETLMQTLLEIEHAMGRERTEKWGPRTIDIDILFYGDRIIDEPHVLHVPHPALHKRRFVLVPLNDIAPDFVHPVLKKTVLQLLQECEDGSEVLQEVFPP